MYLQRIRRVLGFCFPVLMQLRVESEYLAANNQINQSKPKEKTCDQLQARKNACAVVATVSFLFFWLVLPQKSWPITLSRLAYPWQTEIIFGLVSENPTSTYLSLLNLTMFSTEFSLDFLLWIKWKAWNIIVLLCWLLFETTVWKWQGGLPSKWKKEFNFSHPSESVVEAE